ncbi:MAG: universal stress protein [Deltaproteobacteria bacterium]|nr:universal stress protein [Deltaproteobacteria bacterium]
MRVRIKSIICTTDFSDLANHAVPYGIALAKEFGAKLYLCHVIELTSTGMYGEAVVAFENQQNRMTMSSSNDLSVRSLSTGNR